MSKIPFDLDVNNYTFEQIEKFFNLKSNKEYTREDIESKEYRIREQLLHSGHIDKKIKGDLIKFLKEAKEWMINQRTKPLIPATLIPKNYRLDNDNIPIPADPPSRLEEISGRQETKFMYTQPSAVFGGIINPLDRRITTRILTIDTKFRPNYSQTKSSDFLWVFPEKISKVVSMQLKSIEIPQVFYNISHQYGNNYLYIATRDQFFYDYKIFIIPDGFYTNQGLIDILNETLSPKNADGSLQCPDSLFSYIEFTLNIEKGSGNGKVVISTIPRESPILFINLDFSRNINGVVDNFPMNQRIGFILGFTECKYEGCMMYESEAPIQSQILPYFYLSIDDFNNNSNNGFISFLPESTLNPNIFARITVKKYESINTSNFTEVVIKDGENLITEPREYFGPVELQRMQIRLYDSYGRILNMHHRDYSFCLILKVLYDL